MPTWSNRLWAALVAVWVALWCEVGIAAPPRGARFEVAGHETPAALCPAEVRRVAVTLRNVGDQAWEPDAGDRLAYHWRRPGGALVQRDGRRSELPERVEPGESVTVDAKLIAPAEPDDYVLVWRMLREGGGWFPEDPEAVLPVRVAGSSPALAWSVQPFTAPEVAAKGEASLEVTVTNQGCAAWTAESADRMSYRWFSADGRTKVADGRRTSWPRTVAPGDTLTQTIAVAGPPRPGSYVFALSPVRERVAWLDTPTEGTARVRVEVRDAALQWAWDAVAVPPGIATGDTVEVEVEVRNTGTQPWDPALGDRLSYHWVRDGTRLPGEGRRTLLPDVVEPGASLRIPITVVAPPDPGPVQLAVEPLREKVAWYGPPAERSVPEGGPSIEIERPPYVWTLLGVRHPKIPLAGRKSSFVLVVRNDGSRAWEPDLDDRASYHVYSADGRTHVAHGRRTPLPNRVEPGEVVRLEVAFDVPRDSGEVQVRFGLLRENVRWFVTDAAPVSLHVMRRSSLWGLIAVGLLVGWVAAVRRWTTIAWTGWPLWMTGVAIVTTELFADLSRIQLYDRGTPVALSVAAGLGLLVALLPRRAQAPVALSVAGLLALVAWVDLAYAAFFGGLAPLTAVAALHHLVDAKATVSSTIALEHVWLAAPLLSGLVVRRFAGGPRPRLSFLLPAALLLAALPSAVTLGTAVRGDLGVRVFSEAHNAQRFGVLGAHILQALRLIRTWRAGPLSAQARADVWRGLAEIRAARPTTHRGVAKGANLIVLQVEAMQQWVVDAEVGGEPVMPFLSGAHAQALAFDRISDQTAQGRTSDAEFLVLGSGHALREGALSFLRADNEFRTLVHALVDEGYASYSAHPYQRAFWNRSVLHPAYGFADSDFMDALGPGPKVGWGLADGPFLERFGARVDALPEPFVAFGITLSLHHPYDHFPERLETLDVGELDGTWVGNYLQAMRHFDDALAAWFASMHASGLADRTVVLVYGDHVTGMNLDDDVAALSGVPVARYAEARMHRVPAFLWVPGGALKGARDVVGGQIDLGVTALHVLGVEPPAGAVGTPLLEGGPGFAALPNGGVVGPDRMLVRRGIDTPADGACIDVVDGRGRPRSDCDALAERAAAQLQLSRRVLDHDLHLEAEGHR
ncbi:MAG: sulfatase-like hydrolase/transferase [Myxococcota bacterium]